MKVSRPLSIFFNKEYESYVLKMICCRNFSNFLFAIIHIIHQEHVLLFTNMQ